MMALDRAADGGDVRDVESADERGTNAADGGAPDLESADGCGTRAVDGGAPDLESGDEHSTKAVDGGARAASDQSVRERDAFGREAAATGRDAGSPADARRHPSEVAAHRPAAPPFSSMRDVWVGTAALLVAWTFLLLQPLLGIVIMAGLAAIAAGVVRRWRALAVTTGQDRRSP